MSRRLKNINLNGEMRKRVLIVSHNDLDGVMSAFIAHLAYNEMGFDTMIYYDINSSKTKTDQMINDGFEAIHNLSLEDFKEVCVIDRESCTLDMALKLSEKGIDMIHIDHHATNRDYSNMVSEKVPSFTSIYETGSDFIYSGTFLTFKYFEDQLSQLANKDMLYTYTVLTDLYDTFKWTEVPVSADNYLNTLYGVNSEWLNSNSRCLPVDVSAVNLNYIFKFMGGDLFFEDICDSIENGSDIMADSKAIIRKFKYTEDLNLKYIQYAFNDAKKGKVGIYTPEIYQLTYTENGVPKESEVLFVDKPLDFDTSSVSAYRFLKENPNIVLVYRTKEGGYSYSVRSIGEVNTLILSTKMGGGGHKNASGFTLQDEKVKVEEFNLDNKNRLKTKLSEVIDNITLETVF